MFFVGAAAQLSKLTLKKLPLLEDCLNCTPQVRKLSPG